MVKSNIQDKDFAYKTGCINIKWEKYFIVSLMLLILILTASHGVCAQDKGKIAVLPFKIESSEPLEHLKTGLQKMLTDRLADKGYHVINPDVINRQPLNSISYFDTKDLISLGKALGTDWIIWGNLTQTGDKVNLDIKAVDIKNATGSFSIFMVEDNVENLADTMDRTARGIDNRISGIILIEKIEIEGNRRIGDDAILSRIESEEGEPYDENKLNRDLKSIYNMGYFSADLSYRTEDGRNGKIVIFKVIEKPNIVKIIFEGNDKKDDDKLLEEIGIKKYSVLNRNEVKQSINRLLEFYREAGYYNVKISDKITELPNNEVTLTYVIDEGKKVYIRKIEFIGNEVFDDDELKDIIVTREKGFLSWFTSAGLLEKKKLEYDVNNLTVFYYNHGYLKVKVGVPDVKYDPETGLTITIKIVEGKQYSVNDIRFEGDLIIPKYMLLNYVTMKKGKPFNMEAFQNDKQTIIDMYANMGYAYTDISLVPVFNDQENLVDIMFRIDKHEKVRFERINIHGNKSTRDKVIRRELRIVEGDYFSGVKLNRSAENLKRLGFFEEDGGVEINTRRGSSDDLMVVDIDVKERSARSVNGGLGYGGYEGLFAMAQVSLMNFRGLGQSLQTQASISSRVIQFSTSFFEPYLFDTRLSMNTSIFKNRVEDYSYTRDRQGGSIGFGFPLERGDYTRGSITYSIDESKVRDVYYYSSILIQDLAGKYLTSSLTLGVTRNSSNDPWNPRRGSENGFSFQYAGGFLGGDSAFNKYAAASVWYLPMIWKTVFIVKGNVGYVRGRSSGHLPLYEKWRVGGDTTVRGYEYYSISPLDPYTYDELGGNWMWLYSLEYRFPLGKAAGVMAYTFYDMGNAFDKWEDWNIMAGKSVGFGIRWLSPMGPINIGYGYKLIDRPNEASGGKFLISMGYY